MAPVEEVKSRILVIDDDPGFCELLSLYFDAKGFEVATARSAAEATVLLKQGQFDLLILDWYLDGTDSLDLLNLCKKSHPDVPVIIFTGAELESLLNKALKGRADAIVRKLGSLDMLSANVFHCLGLPELKVLKPARS
jgi:two-component system response regulator HydG